MRLRHGNRDVSFQYLRANWDPLVVRLPAWAVMSLVSPLGGLCTAAERDTFAEFFKERVLRRLFQLPRLKKTRTLSPSNRANRPPMTSRSFVVNGRLESI